MIIPIIVALLPISQATILFVSSRVGDSSTIQAAINNATSGDIILVDNGIYQENLNVNKINLTLRGMMGPVVSGRSSGSVITINADGVVLEGFVVKDSDGCGEGIFSDPLEPEAGIKVNSKKNTIRFNHVRACCCGIFINSSSDNSIDHNMVDHNDKYGIYLNNSRDNHIFGNTANSNKYGIYLNTSNNNKIHRNNASDNAYSNNGNGIYLRYSSKNNLSRNTALKNEICGILLYESVENLISYNKICDNEKIGINLLLNCSNNTISINTVRKNKWGIKLQRGCNDNKIVGNTAIGSKYGLHLGFFNENNTITSNTARVCSSGGILIQLGNSGNSIYGNNFLNNGKQNAEDGSGTNIWDDGSSGNYYDDFHCIDGDGDGICDEEHRVGDSGAVDRYPLASKVETAGVRETSSGMS